MSIRIHLGGDRYVRCHCDALRNIDLLDCFFGNKAGTLYSFFEALCNYEVLPILLSPQEGDIVY